MVNFFNGQIGEWAKDREFREKKKHKSLFKCKVVLTVMNCNEILFTVRWKKIK
jgi:uncharacterized membrane protein YsdA (DUF1294 family)